MLLSQVNWRDKESVIAYAELLAKRSIVKLFVVKYPDRDNYNITFRVKPEAVKIWQSHQGEL